MPLQCKEATIFGLGLLMGTGSTIVSKVVFDWESTGLDGEHRKFGKPLMQTFVMFVGMAFAIPLYFLFRWFEERKADKSDIEKQRIEGPQVDPLAWNTLMALAIPSGFDLVGTALSSAGLMYTTVSVFQLVRCTVIIVTAIFRRFLLDDQIQNYKWFGLFLNAVAMVVVSVTSFVQPGEEAGGSSNPQLGIVFILLSCVVQAAQYVFEERVMSTNLAPPLIVVGMEGVWGSAAMLLLVFPAAYYIPGSDHGGRMEDVWDSILMLRNSPSLLALVLLFGAIVFFYNVFCIYVTHLLDAVWHAILDNFRPVSVWTTDLLIFYVFTEGQFGESWGPWSWVQLLGMIILFYGTAVYNGNIRIGYFDYDEYEEIPDPDVKVLPPFPSAPALSSPYITHTPRKIRNDGTPVIGGTRRRRVDSHSSRVTGTPLSSLSRPSNFKPTVDDDRF